MTTTTVFRNIARIAVGAAFAGAILGQAGTALAETSPSDYSYSDDSYYSEDAQADDYYSEDDHYSEDHDPGMSDEAEAVAPALFLDGTVSGRMELTEVTCDLLTDWNWVWTAVGTVDGIPANVTFATNFYRGPGDYNSTTITDEAGGQMTAEVGDVQVVSNGATEGIVTVDAGEQSGYVDAILEGTDDQSIRVSGTWQCFA